MSGTLAFTPSGIYCPAGDFYIDPWKPVNRALITHGHADHARRGMGSYLTTDIAAPVMRHRLGDVSIDTIGYGERLQIGGATVSFHPAGHVPGSAQIRIDVAGEVWVASGDYKVVDDGLSTPFEPVKCHHFITESTFGLPVFRWARSGGHRRADQRLVGGVCGSWQNRLSWLLCFGQGATADVDAEPRYRPDPDPHRYREHQCGHACAGHRIAEHAASRP